MSELNNKIKLFEGKKVRAVWDRNAEKWRFSILDIISVLTDQSDYEKTRNYWKWLKGKLRKEGSKVVSITTQLKLLAPDGKMRLTDVADTEQVLRLLQSIPSPKAEPFKMWLAVVGNERLEEIENPELAQRRMKELYKAKGYSDSWIDKRLRGIAVRDTLTDEWKARGVKEGKEYSILTAEISKATFGLTPSEYHKLKGLNKENLRDHMTDLELIFTMLGEASTTEIAQNTDAQGFAENKTVARKGGVVAGNARKQLEQESGKNVVSKVNYMKKKQLEK